MPTNNAPDGLVTLNNAITLGEARDLLERVLGHRPDHSTVYRWVLNGRAGIRLPHLRLGKRIVTSVAALEWWMKATAEASVPTPAPSDEPASLVHDAELEAACAAEGL